MDLLKESEQLFQSIVHGLITRRQVIGPTQFIAQQPRTATASSSAYIHCVPKDLSDGNDSQYKPQVISIGPLHCTSACLIKGQEIKVAYFRDFCSRWFREGMLELKPIIQALKDKENSVRGCYRDIPDISSDEFVKMMLIDGCFILELLWRKQQGNYMYKKQEQDPVFDSPGMIKTVVRDLFLFENQLPYFLLDDLFVRVRSCYKTPTLYSSIESLVQMVTGVRTSLPADNIRGKTLHILELAWYFVVCPNKDSRVIAEENAAEKALRRAKSVSELEKYGMKLNPNQNDRHFPLAISNGILEIRTMELDESKSTLFWNLLAFERLVLADTNRGNVFQSLILVMNSLIKDENDVNLLCSRDIIINRMNDSSQVVLFFKKLAQKVNREDILSFCYHDFFKEMDAYCNSPTAYLIHNYYDVRWDVLNAVLLFILTFTQTFFSIISYDNKK